MKAKVKETGKVLEVELNRCMSDGINGIWVYTDNDGKVYSHKELDFINIYPDWQNVRIQAAIAAMQAIISRVSLHYGNVDDCANDSIAYADALIEELKKAM